MDHGIINGVGASRFRAHMVNGSTTQTIGNTSETKVIFDTVDYDNLGEFNTTTYRFTASQSGYYLITAQVWWAPTVVADKRYMVKLYKGGVDYLYEISHSSHNAAIVHRVTDIVYLAASNYIEVYVYQDSGVNGTLQNGPDNCVFMGHRLS